MIDFWILIISGYQLIWILINFMILLISGYGFYFFVTKNIGEFESISLVINFLMHNFFGWKKAESTRTLIKADTRPAHEIR